MNHILDIAPFVAPVISLIALYFTRKASLVAQRASQREDARLRVPGVKRRLLSRSRADLAQLRDPWCAFETPKDKEDIYVLQLLEADSAVLEVSEPRIGQPCKVVFKPDESAVFARAYRMVDEAANSHPYLRDNLLTHIARFSGIADGRVAEIYREWTAAGNNQQRLAEKVAEHCLALSHIVPVLDGKTYRVRTTGQEQRSRGGRTWTREWQSVKEFDLPIVAWTQIQADRMLECEEVPSS